MKTEISNKKKIELSIFYFNKSAGFYKVNVLSNPAVMSLRPVDSKQLIMYRTEVTIRINSVVNFDKKEEQPSRNDVTIVLYICMNF